MPDNAEDEQLQQAIAGDRGAIAELLLNSTDDLTRYLSRELGSSPPADVAVEDVLQDTFYVAFRDMEKFKPQDGAKFQSWLRTIARHRLLDAIKSRKRKKRGGDHQQVTADGAADSSYLNVLDALPADETLPFRQVTRQEAVQCLQVALAELSEEHRQVIQLRYIEEQTYEEIGHMMGRSDQAVHGLLKRAKEKLREALGHASSYLSSRT